MFFRRWLMLAALLAAMSAAAQIAVPALKAHVTDTTGTLTSSEEQALDSKLAAFEQRKGSQIAVLIVPTTGDETIEQYGIRVAEAWKLGRKSVDDGVILLVAKDDRALRIEVGYGLEGAVPDVIAKRIISETITPYFRNGDFYTGISAGVDAMIKVVDGEPLPEPSRERSHGARQLQISPLGVLAVIIGVIVGFVVRFSSNRVAGAGTALIVSGIIAALLIGLAGALIYAAFAFIFVIGGAEAVLYGMLSGGGGRGGGGFSGGGGGFGGGGASGRW
ncbi:MAG: hypothetical protein JWQ90_2785 [Hydrocarboniphaga sp.]|uniref:TPM domain-containing protein n=1 Tax=Hydrocarboniphaga sp. TaxID=2033016 RepID=UPI00261BB92B|nr:TPM domain-containing protein [Hydrocarboniphaga sp.]MDB5970335.1 hypothetical protein [Hydrocarboniphaga sp.]